MLVQRIGLLALAFLLTACEHNVYLVGRTSGVTGNSTVVANPGQNGGDISIAIGKKTYTGKWVYVADGGAIGVGTATAVSGTAVATASGTTVVEPMHGGGSILASASDGTRLRCSFGYNDWSKTGTGLCKDSKGETYDLQIN